MTKKRLAKLGWPEDMKGVPLLLICHGSSTTPGKIREYFSNIPSEEILGMIHRTKKSVTQPKCVALWRGYFHIVDGHNRKRTGIVAMHDVWRTNSWINRDFGELFGIMIVNGE